MTSVLQCIPSSDARYDRWSGFTGHLLIILFLHAAGFFDATDCEQAALLAFVREAERFLDKRFCPDGYNIGVNVGGAAGQTVIHLHVHVTPRYARDMADPRAGCEGDSGEEGVLSKVL